MGSESKPNKFHYDLSMSKRTRRSLNLVEDDHDQGSFQAWHEEEECALEFAIGDEEKGSISLSEASENDQKKSLKQLIGGRSLSQHFSQEEPQLQLVVKQHDQEGLNGLKFTRMVSRYAKALSHLIKLKRKQQMGLYKKPVLPLTN
ncbi:uncharacterized protein [Coffea arabica]|uniref:Uncharacterized protein n=1 Tax=Coffea arabica TaxID=13443 RepID=A0ABM4WMD0_COFAR